MGLTDVEIAIAVGWGLRGVLVLLTTACLVMRGAHPHTRVLVLGWFLLAASFVGSFAEFNNLGLRYARLAEVAVGSWFVGGLYSAVFKLDPVAWMFGTTLLVGSNVLYTLAAVVSTSAPLEAGLLVIAGAIAAGALIHMASSRTYNLVFEWIAVVAAAVFYVVVALQTVFGPWVLAEWSRTVWAIVWEVAITLFYSAVVIGAWFYYTPATPQQPTPSDWFDMIEYVFQTNQWSVPAPKMAD